MMIDVAVIVVTVGFLGFAASRVMARQQPMSVAVEPPQPLPPQRIAPRHFALPPVTIETLPMKFVPMVPPIDRGVFAALAAADARAAATPRPVRLARGSIPPGTCEPPGACETSPIDAADLDSAETLRAARDLDDDAATRTTMSPVR